MNLYKNLKTSQKISITFSIFNFFSLLLLLFSVNLSYFFIWYTDIKKESLYDMNINYNSYIWWMEEDNKKAFQNYILSKDTIITPHDWSEMVCSSWVSEKLHSSPEEIKKVMNSFFYTIDEKTYFVFSKNYEDIWEISVLYDTTDYFRSQLIIIKVSLLVILFSIILNYFLWKYISRVTLKKLKNIANEVNNIDINGDLKKLSLSWPKDDEIRILWEVLNKSFSKIKSQSENQKQFITDVSHEFKTPLMVINSKIDLYNKASSLWKKVDLDNLLSDIKIYIKKLNNLLETMFFISRVQDKTIALNKEKINLQNFICKITSDLQILFKEKEIIINNNIKEDFFLYADRSTLNILLENLLTNSIKFNNRKVIIDIKLEWNKLIIKDNWNGIEKETLKSIWDKFSRFDKSVEWFWVWLFLVKRILKLYNWKIEVKSDLWKWSEFIIKF